MGVNEGNQQGAGLHFFDGINRGGLDGQHNVRICNQLPYVGLLRYLRLCVSIVRVGCSTSGSLLQNKICPKLGYALRYRGNHGNPAFVGLRFLQDGNFNGHVLFPMHSVWGEEGPGWQGRKTVVLHNFFWLI